MKKAFFASLLIAGFAASAQQAPVSIIPQPNKVELLTGSFTISPATTLVVSSADLDNSAKALNGHLKQYYGFSLKTAPTAGPQSIVLSKTKINDATEGAYQLKTGAEGVTIKANGVTGVFYGVQSLLQLMPVAKNKSLLVKIPAVMVEDAPRFGYRGLMLDVARHYESVDFIKKTLDRLAMLKINTFHWHLTEDQGWRIEIKKYPRLTSVGGFRDGTIIGRYPGSGNDNERYGGFYTQEQVKDIVQYAADRYISVIPEIEMPGHSAAAIAAYPFLSCFPDEETMIPKHPSEVAKANKGKKVMESWGVYEDIFVPSEQTFQFLQDVIDEIVPLFPGKYIHIGGDEVPKAAWKRSAFCQQLMKEKGLKDEHELQSYFIQRMEKYINSKGKQIIGWDEILEGGLAPNATVMSWRGEQGGIDAAKQKHEVIMSPTTYAYLDYSQTKNEDSVTIGGFLPLEKVYNYDPLPEQLQGTEFAKYVKGAQGNLWTEYVRYPAKVEYMLYPRLAALSEAAWTQPANKSWESFQQRIPVLFSRLDMMRTNYSRAYYEISASIVPTSNNNGVEWKLDTKQTQAKIYYTTPGNKKETLYTNPIPVVQDGSYTATMKANDKMLNTVSQVFNLHAATGKKITVTTAPSRNYPGNNGVQGLTNGAISQKGMNSTEWCGWEGGDLEAVIDLGAAQPVNEVSLYCMESQGSWIYRPASFTVWLSTDGKTYVPAGTITTQPLTTEFDARNLAVKTNKTTARYIKVMAKHYGEIPTGMPGAGHKAWLFADEIMVK